MENNILKLKTDNNGEVEIEVLDIINNGLQNKDYIVYRLRDKDDVLISILNQTETGFSLDTIEDANEFREIENYLASKINDNSGAITL